MTRAEFEALPEDGVFSYEDRLIDGRAVRVPHYTTVGALSVDQPRDGWLVADGERWIIGWANGQRWKRRL